MQLEFPELKNSDLTRFRNLQFPLAGSTFKPSPIEDHERETFEFYKQISDFSRGRLEAFHFFLLTEISEEAENTHRFNMPGALLIEEDYEFWCKYASWSNDEFAALLIGRKPEIVNFASVKNEGLGTSIGKDFERAHILIQRAVRKRHMEFEASPKDRLLWALETRLELPELFAKVAEKYGLLVDEAYSPIIPSASDQAENVVELDKAITSSDRNIKPPLSVKERESLLKIVMGVALDSYGYKPSEKNSTAREMSDDLSKHGLSLDNDTIRKYLKEGEQLIPRDQLIFLQENEFPAA